MKDKHRKKTKTKMKKRSKSYIERVRAKQFCCAFKLGFLQLICQAFLIFTSIISKREIIIQVKTCCGGV